MKAVNLIPVEEREGSGSLAGRSGGGALIVLGLVAGLAVLAFLYGNARHSEAKSHAELGTVNVELTETRAQIGKMAPYTTFIAMANQRVQTVAQLVASRFDWSHAFNELGRVLPRDAALSSLRGQIGAVGNGSSSSSSPAGAASATPTSVTPPGSTPVFAIGGCATSQSEVAQTLQRLRLIDGVAEVTLQTSTKSASGASSAAASSGSEGPCGSGAAIFSAQIAFNALPSAPVVNSPHSTQSTGSTASPASNGAVAVSAQTGASR